MQSLELLEHYRPEAGEELAHYAATKALAACGAAALDRMRFEPGHLTGSVFVVCRTTERALLIFHRRLRRWLQPGGHAEPGEIDLRVTATRELREETGIALEPGALRIFDVDVHVIPATAAAPLHNHYDLRFLAFVPDESGHAGSDAEEMRWIAIAELMALEAEPSIRRMSRKARLAGRLS